MAKLELKGKFMEVCPVELVGKNNIKKQIIRFLVPAYRDEYGEVKGTDEIWELATLGDNVDKLALTTDLELKKAHLKCYVNSNTVKDQSEPAKSRKPDMYIVNLVLASFTLV